MKKQPKTKTVDLSKCKVGQRVRLRHGREATFKQRIKGKCIFPFAYQIDGAQSTIAVNQHGSYLNSTEAHDFDIVAVLPLPKKKAPQNRNIDTNDQHKDIYSGPSQKSLMEAKDKRNGSIRKIIKLLEGLIQP